jgi:cell cycle arrest protein BUB3
MAETPNEFKLKNAPEDGISAVKFGTTNQFLLASSWDQTVRLYDVISNSLRIQYSHSEPVLDCCFYVSNRGNLSWESSSAIQNLS